MYLTKRILGDEARVSGVPVRCEIGFVRGEVLVFTAVRVVGFGVAAGAGANG